MPFQKGHAPYPRRTSLVETQIVDDVEPEAEPLPIRRLSPDTVDDWLIERLNAAWGQRDWRGLLRVLMSMNDVLLIANDSAALCAIRMRHLMGTGALEVHEEFAFSRYARRTQDGLGWTIPDEENKAPLVDLYRYARVWKAEMGAVGMVVCKCSDLTVSDLRRCSWKGTRNLLEIQ